MSALSIDAAFEGLTTPLNEILDEIHGRGWEPTVNWSSDQFVAKGKNPHGESLEATGPTDATAAGNLLVKIMRRELVRNPIAKVAQWNLQEELTNSLEDMAKEYAQAPVYDPKAAPFWKELADDSVRRAEVIKQQIQVEVVADPEPYATPAEMCEDVHKNKHFYVSSANSQHPIWTVEQNVAFRIVHDVLGHCVSGGDFGWQGELQACGAHFPLLTPNAQKALFVECIMQTGAAAYYRSFMQQKVFDPGERTENLQQKNNPAGHQGIHPSQSLVPEQMPQVAPSTPQGLPWATQIPHQDFQGALPVFGSAQGQDPNANWSSEIDPMPNNAYLWANDPLQSQEVTDNALKIDAGWHKLDEASMKQAIVNAFRVVLLSPRKNLKWNAVHYQDIAHIPADTDDPKRYWDALESRREAWNQARGFAPGSHKPYWKELVQFKKYVRAAHPDLDEWEADEIADREFMHMWNEEEERIANDPKNSKLDADELERKVAKDIGKRLKSIFKPSIPKADHGHEQMHILGATQYDLEGNEAGKYGAFMGSHLRAIAQISQHSDELLKAAIEDVQNHDGSGHHFRATTLGLGIPGVGPKVASFAWLLLQPATSQLATIDTHMMDVLGRDYDKEMNNRDYFRFERELAAGRDAAGYGHVPLGQFQWGMWDLKRIGPGTHQDHSSMKVLDPTPHDQVDWAQERPVDKDWIAPDWWEQTKPARDMVVDDWERNVATQFPRGRVPRFGTKKLAASDRIPWILWGEYVWIGQPGETFMNLARRELGYTMEQVWQRLPEHDFSAGSYDPSQQMIFPQDQITGQQVDTIRRNLQSAG